MIEDAPTLKEKLNMEVRMMSRRRTGEIRLLTPIDDKYGLGSIDAMVADMKAEYAQRMADEEATAHTTESVSCARSESLQAQHVEVEDTVKAHAVREADADVAYV
jgi:hypothetical protein